jgi:cytochrome P450
VGLEGDPASEHRLPAGAFVLAMIAPVMNHPRWWTSPETFDPERLSNERTEDKKHRGAFLPFGAGAHACIGAQLSTLEAKAFWHTLLARAVIRLTRPCRGVHQITPLGVVSGDVHLTLARA